VTDGPGTAPVDVAGPDVPGADDAEEAVAGPEVVGLDVAGQSRSRLVITYCTQCRWLLRAGWVAQELLTTFTTDLGEVALRPGVGGVFTVQLDDELLWDRTRDGRFPEIPALKRLVRDRIAPGRSLGHSERT
jgi:selenoprotein W-related protein